MTHVGIYVGNGADGRCPAHRRDVRVESFPTTVGAPWNDEEYVGATQPV